MRLLLLLCIMAAGAQGSMFLSAGDVAVLSAPSSACNAVLAGVVKA